MAKDRIRRYQSAAEVLQALEEVRSRAQPLSGPRMEERQPDAVFGREEELQKLDALLGSAIAGTGRFVLVTGEPGIGKTALTASFVHNARKRNSGVLLAHGACVEQYGAAEPYLLFLDALGSLLNGPGRDRVIATLRQFAPTWCLQFPAIFSSDAMEQLQRDATGLADSECCVS